jgi:hypothetical protein
MPVTISIDKQWGIVNTTIEGRVSTDELIEKLTGFLNRPDFTQGLNGLADLRYSDMDTKAIDVERVAKLMVDYREKIGPSKTAVVVSRKVIFGMTRMFQAFSEQSSIEVEIFEDIDEARRWLGIGGENAGGGEL